MNTSRQGENHRHLLHDQEADPTPLRRPSVRAPATRSHAPSHSGDVLPTSCNIPFVNGANGMTVAARSGSPPGNPAKCFSDSRTPDAASHVLAVPPA
jgi:hypothetical protein